MAKPDNREDNVEHLRQAVRTRLRTTVKPKIISRSLGMRFRQARKNRFKIAMLVVKRVFPASGKRSKTKALISKENNHRST